MVPIGRPSAFQCSGTDIEGWPVALSNMVKGVKRGAIVANAVDWVKERGVARIEIRVATGNREGQAFWRELGFDDLLDVLQRRL